ncbi:MAG TPA: IS5 family transposase [Oligoflexus sp.]|uniref:IS5 family transposase n=1 Tax=Oligoflexus sp. TaxID=1971216 RepID=UPI002D47DFC6|nr:IS5 family transposase [Oligoflexus sp.]HYX35156.1 IS5 family transposase [Oligoflexus sp.]
MDRESYQNDISDLEWDVLKIFMPPEKFDGRPRTYQFREILNGVFYVVRTGCQWRQMPHDLPPWQTSYHYFRDWKINGVWEKINNEMRKMVRAGSKKNEEPSAAIIDSQSVKASEAGEVSGYDAGKKIKGRKRHIIVDTLGLIIKVVVLQADIQDRQGAMHTIEAAKEKLRSIKIMWADGGYSGQLIEWAKSGFNFILEIVKRSDDVEGFKVLPMRWIVERTFGWLGRNRRLSKDYERLPSSSEALVYIGMIRLMLHRLV